MTDHAQPFDLEVDVVVLGTGGSGLTAAMHGHANECSIALFINDADAYVLELHDNGVGLGESPIEPGRGSSLISAWVDSLNGRWSLGPATVGTTLIAIVPVA